MAELDDKGTIRCLEVVELDAREEARSGAADPAAHLRANGSGMMRATNWQPRRLPFCCENLPDHGGGGELYRFTRLHNGRTGKPI